MKRFKRVAALACAGTMLVSQAIPAFAGDSTVNTNVGVENDNSALSGVYDVVLPASETTAYDFTIDPDGLLGIYSEDSTDTSNKAVFKKTTAATAKANAATGKPMNGKLFAIEKYEELSGGADLLTDLGGADTGTEAQLETLLSTGFGSDAVAPYAVWVPVKTEQGMAEAKGEFKPIESVDDLKLYADVEIESGKVHAITMKGTPYTPGTDPTLGDNVNLTGDNVFDGKLYKYGYVAITKADGSLETGYDLMDYITVDSEGEMEFAEELKVVKDVSNVLTLQAETIDSTYVEYTKASIAYDNTSDDIVITNKSLGSVAIDVELNVNTDTGLKFDSQSNVSGGTAGDIYVGLFKGSDEVAAVKQVVGSDINGKTSNAYTDDAAVLQCKTSATFVVAGVADGNAIKYQGTDADRDESTNSHNYHSYVAPYSNPSSLELSLKTEIATGADWTSYVKDLRNGTKFRPSPQLVFSFNEDLGQVAKNAAGTEFKNDNVKYTVDNTKGNKVTTKTRFLSADECGLTLSEDGATYTFTIPDTPALTNAETKSLTFKSIKKDAAQTDVSTAVKVTNGTGDSAGTFSVTAKSIPDEGVTIQMYDGIKTDGTVGDPVLNINEELGELGADLSTHTIYEITIVK